MSPDGGAQIGPVEGSMVPDLYTFSYEIQRKLIRNLRTSEQKRALRSQVGAPGGSCSERYRATFSLSFGGAIQISSYISPILSEKLTQSYNEIYTFREIENAHISLGVFKKSKKIALPPSMAFTFFVLLASVAFTISTFSTPPLPECDFRTPNRLSSPVWCLASCA